MGRLAFAFKIVQEAGDGMSEAENQKKTSSRKPLYGIILLFIFGTGTWLANATGFLKEVKGFFVHDAPKTTPSPANAAPAPAPEPIQYSGRVTDEGGKPIPNATVMVFADQSVGQSRRTDANGLFQVQLAAETKSLRLVVTAPGFGDMTVETSVHRTGPEEVFLRRLVNRKQPTKGEPAFTAPTSPPPTSPPPVVNNSAPGGFAISGGTVVNPTVNNYRAPFPAIEPSPSNPENPRSQTGPFSGGVSGMLPRTPYSSNPGASVSVVLKGPFTSPAFVADCSVPCYFEGQTFVSRDYLTITTDPTQYYGIYANNQMWGGAGYNMPLPPGAIVRLYFRSRDSRSLTLSNVRPFDPNQPQ
jgi:Carboxypeptidase regulatory-like domain